MILRNVVNQPDRHEKIAALARLNAGKAGRPLPHWADINTAITDVLPQAAQQQAVPEQPMQATCKANAARVNSPRKTQRQNPRKEAMDTAKNPPRGLNFDSAPAAFVTQTTAD